MRRKEDNSVSLAPFIHTEKNAPYIYLTMIAAMVPCAIYGTFYYGLRAIILILFCMLTFTLSDMLFTHLAGRGGKGEYFDLSSASSGLMLALILPPDTSLVTALAAVLFGSIVTKQIFGGPGSNLVNPAAAGRLFVSLVMPSSVKGYAEGGTEGWFILRTLIFGSKSGEFHDYTNCTFPELITGNFPGSIGAACATCVLLGGFFLVMRGSIRMYAPIAYLVTLTVFFPLSNVLEKGKGFGYEGYVAFMLASGVVFVAVYMLGDLTTMPSRFSAGFFAGMVCALLTLVLRAFIRPDTALLAPVLSVNFMSFVLDFLTKTLSRKNLRSREVDVR
jgi:Na+-translocating ferredoxin:NAD+ oxidoreductase RnfD subunit